MLQRPCEAALRRAPVARAGVARSGGRMKYEAFLAAALERPGSAPQIHGCLPKRLDNVNALSMRFPGPCASSRQGEP
jgi:hypothetical protein